MHINTITLRIRQRGTETLCLAGTLLSLIFLLLCNNNAAQGLGETTKSQSASEKNALDSFSPLPDKTLWEISAMLSHKQCALANNIVVFQDENGTAVALNAQNGKQIWRRELAEESVQSAIGTQYFRFPHLAPAIFGNHVLVSLSTPQAGRLFALDLYTGVMQWQYVSPAALLPSGIDPHDFIPTSGPIMQGPIVYNNSVFVRTRGGLTAIRLTDGKEIWNAPLDKYLGQFAMATPPPVCAKNKVFLGADWGIAYALDINTGHLLWSFTAQALQSTRVMKFEKTTLTPNACSPIIVQGRVLTADGLGNVYALAETNGKLLWRINIGQTWQFASHGADLYAASTGGLYQLNPKDGHIIRALVLTGGTYSCLLMSSKILITGNYRDNPGWAVVDLKTWKPEWHDKDLNVCYGISMGANILVVGGRTLNRNTDNTVLRAFSLP